MEGVWSSFRCGILCPLHMMVTAKQTLGHIMLHRKDPAGNEYIRALIVVVIITNHDWHTSWVT